MDLIEMKDEANYKLKRAKEIASETGEDGVLTEDQKTEIKTLKKEATLLLEKIEAIRETENIQKEVGEAYDRLKQPQERKVPQAQPGVGAGYEAKHIEFASSHPSKYASFKGKNAEENAHKMGTWVMAKVFGKVKELEDHPKVKDARRAIHEWGLEERALGTTTNVAGGATVPQELAAAIIERREKYGVFENLTNRVPVQGTSALWPRVTSDQMAAFGNEGTAITEADATFDNIELNPRPIRTLSRINNELINSSAIDIGEFVANDFGRRFAKRIDTAGFIGAGEVANGGITGAFARLEANTGFAGNIVAAGNTTAAVTQANLTDMLGILPQYAAQAEPFWICNRKVKEGVFGRLQMASGGTTKLETTMGTFDSYSGVPIVTTQISKSPGTTDDVFLLLGDLRLASFMGVSDEITFATTSERYFEFNQTGIRGVMNADINVYDFGSTTTDDTGSIVALRST